LGASTGASKADIAEALVVRLNKSRTRVRRVNSHDFEQLVAYRPKDMRMIVSRIEARLGLLMPSLDEEIQRVAAEYH
jgi:dTDP-4-dehydrorhamnose reductase